MQLHRPKIGFAHLRSLSHLAYFIAYLNSVTGTREKGQMVFLETASQTKDK